MGKNNRFATSNNDRDKKSKKENRQETARNRHESRENPARKPRRETQHIVRSVYKNPVQDHGAVEMAAATKYKMDRPEAMREAERWAQRTLEKGKL
uniref:Uncharacterized protein n=1 Tax=Acrobeloides nanus TaxID=290746 RepID=A0A914DIT3_9BILA